MKSHLHFFDGQSLKPHGRMAASVLHRAIVQALPEGTSFHFEQVEYTASIRDGTFRVRVQICDLLESAIEKELVLDIPQGFFKAKA